MSSGPTQARVMDVVEPSSAGATILSVAVISPDEQRRHAVASALCELCNHRIREFTSYSSEPGEVPRMLNRDFDAILVDLDSDQARALDLVRRICTHGLATVMVYSAQADPGLTLRAMRAGAREFLTLPFKPGALVEALARTSILRSAERPQKTASGKLLVFLCAKGGAGVTTLACNFAVSLAEESRQKTLLIDLSLPLGGVAINLGIVTGHSTVNALQNPARLDSKSLLGLLEKHNSGLLVLAAPSELAPAQVTDEALGKLLKIARQNFDYVVIDAGSRLDLRRVHLFGDSATFYLVTQVGLAELRNSNRLISKLSAACGSRVEIVINRYDPLSVEIGEEDVSKALTRPAEWKIPNDYAAVRRMQRTAIPLVREDSEISSAIRQMARSVCGGLPAPEQK
jgi:pilus assembly protein CpaE